MKSLVTVLTLTLLIRLFGFSNTPPGLYWDELDTGYQAYSLLLTGRDYFGNAFPIHLQSFADFRSGLYMYLTVPFVKLLGLTSYSVRFAAILNSGLLAICGFLFAYFVLKLGKHSWIFPLTIISAPWTLVQGRIAAESQLLLPLILLSITAIVRRKYNLAAITLGLCLWAYPTAKIFVPLFIISTYLIYRSQIRLSHLKIPVIIFAIIAFLPIWETFSKPVAKRFSEISVFSDPTISKQIEIDRQFAYLGRGGEYKLGLQTGLIERLSFNKFSNWGSKILSNYTNALSTNFLFTTPDPNLRHNPAIPHSGQFYLIEIIPMVLGILFVLIYLKASKINKLLLVLLFIAPLPAVFTRDGSNHAPRLLFLLIPLVSFISLGWKILFRHKIWGLFVFCIFLISFVTGMYHFSSIYRVHSAGAFNCGFLEAATYAKLYKDEYDQIILDGANESLLMAYLFTSQYPPSIFQKSFPLPSNTISTGVEGYQFDNINILYPGTRDWNQIKLDQKSLLIVSTLQPHANDLPIIDSISLPDSTSAFNIAVKP